MFELVTEINRVGDVVDRRLKPKLYQPANNLPS